MLSRLLEETDGHLMEETDVLPLMASFPSIAKAFDVSDSAASQLFSFVLG